MDISGLLATHAEYLTDSRQWENLFFAALGVVVLVAVGFRTIMVANDAWSPRWRRTTRLLAGTLIGVMAPVYSDANLTPTALQSITSRGIVTSVDQHYGVLVDRKDVLKAWRSDGEPVRFHGFWDGDYQPLWIRIDESAGTVTLTTEHGTELPERTRSARTS